jgi:hypothetical protein
MTKKELVLKIQRLEQNRQFEISQIYEKYALLLNVLKGLCDHIDDEGNSSLERVGHPWHSGWDVCSICEKYIETNEYGRD